MKSSLNVFFASLFTFFELFLGFVPASEQLCAHCFDVLHNIFESELNLDQPSALPTLPNTTGVEVEGLFVTWKKKSNVLDEDYSELRGCIGQLSKLDLSEVTNYAYYASQHDRRFKPISKGFQIDQITLFDFSLRRAT